MSDSAKGSWDFINKGSRYMLLDNVSKGLEPLLVLLCARLYAGGEWGFFKYYESLLLLLMRVAVVGLDRGVVWIYTKRGGDEGFARAFSRAVNFTFLFAVILALVAGAQWAGLLPSFGRFAKHDGAATWFDVACYLTALPAQAATLLFLQAFINKQALFPVLFLRNVVQPIAIYGPAVLLHFTPLREHGLALPYLFGSCLGLALALFWYFKLFRLPLRSWAPSAWVTRDLLRFSLPLAGTDVLMSFAYRLDMLLLAKYAGMQAVEIYSVIVWAANTLRGIRQSFDSILLSVFSKGEPGRYHDEQGRAFNYASFIVLSIQIPFVPLALLFGNDLLGLVATQYATGGPVLAIAVAFNLGITFGAFAGQLVTGIGKTWWIVVSQAVYFVVSVVLNLWMVPRWGLTGAAIAMGSSSLISGGVCLFSVMRIGRTALFRRDFMLPLGLAALLFVPSVAAHYALRPSVWLEAPAFAVVTTLFALFTHGRVKRFNRHFART